MKQQKLSKKLFLNRKTVANLNRSMLGNVRGKGNTETGLCNSCMPTCQLGVDSCRCTEGLPTCDYSCNPALCSISFCPGVC
jgi:hypothetical protein